MPTYANNYSAKTVRDREALREAQDVERKGRDSERSFSLADTPADKAAKSHVQNMKESAREDAEQRVIDNYPAGTKDGDGRKSRNKAGYGKPAQFANGGLVGCKYKK